METVHRFIAMVRYFPVRSAVFIGAPVVALTLQFVMSLYHGYSLVLPASFALVALVGSIAATRYHLAEFHVLQVYREASIDRV